MTNEADQRAALANFDFPAPAAEAPPTEIDWKNLLQRHLLHLRETYGTEPDQLLPLDELSPADRAALTAVYEQISQAAALTQRIEQPRQPLMWSTTAVYAMTASAIPVNLGLTAASARIPTRWRRKP